VLQDHLHTKNLLPPYDTNINAGSLTRIKRKGRKER